MTDIGVNKYEAHLFMTAARAAQVTKSVVSALRSGFRAGKYSRWKFVSDGLYREQVLDRLVSAAVRAAYAGVMRRAGDIRKPEPSGRLVAELSRAYRKKARGFTSILRIVMRGVGALFEDEADRIRPTIRPSALAQAALNTARHFRQRYLTTQGRLSGAQRAALVHDYAMLNGMVGDVIGSGGLTQAEIDEIAAVMTGMQVRLST